MWPALLDKPAKALSYLTSVQSLFGSHSPQDSSPSLRHEVPGGTPFSFCDVSRSTDLFQIDNIDINQMPIYIDDVFTVNLYGKFIGEITPNASVHMYTDCFPKCDLYKTPPEDRHPFKILSLPFCNFNSEIEQPLGRRKKNETCPPEVGPALLQTWGYVWPMFLRTPGWYNFTFDAQTAEGKRIYCLTTEVCLRWRDDKWNDDHSTGPWGRCHWPR